MVCGTIAWIRWKRSGGSGQGWVAHDRQRVRTLTFDERTLEPLPEYPVEAESSLPLRPSPAGVKDQPWRASRAQTHLSMSAGWTGLMRVVKSRSMASMRAPMSHMETWPEKRITSQSGAARVT